MTDTLRILFLDDCAVRHEAMDRAYPGAAIVHCYTVSEVRSALDTTQLPFDIVSLDHDLNDYDTKSFRGHREETGVDACVEIAWYREKLPDTITIHSVNPCGAANMRSVLQAKEFRVRWIPFSVSTDGEAQ